jgi:hypothetical protein
MTFRDELVTRLRAGGSSPKLRRCVYRESRVSLLVFLFYGALLVIPPAAYARIRLQESVTTEGTITARTALGSYAVFFAGWALLVALSQAILVAIGVIDPLDS